MKFRVHSPVVYGVLSAGLLSTACNRPSTGPQSALAPATAVSEFRAPSSAATVVFPLVRGSFVIDTDGADGIVGTYAGAATLGSDGRQQASLTLQVTGGSGAFSGATGSVLARGEGAFSGEGTFALDGSGEIRVGGGKRAVLVLRMRGSSTADCTVSNQIAISQTAVGTVGRLGRVAAVLTHAVENAGCTS